MTAATTGQNYGFKVSAINAVGEGPQSPVAQIIAATVPLAATNLTKVSSDITQCTFSWTAAANGGSPLTGYKVYWNNGSGSTFTLLQDGLAVIT